MIWPSAVGKRSRRNKIIQRTEEVTAKENIKKTLHNLPFEGGKGRYEAITDVGVNLTVGFSEAEGEGVTDEVVRFRGPQGAEEPLMPVGKETRVRQIM